MLITLLMAWVQLSSFAQAPAEPEAPSAKCGPYILSVDHEGLKVFGDQNHLILIRASTLASAGEEILTQGFDVHTNEPMDEVSIHEKKNASQKGEFEVVFRDHSHFHTRDCTQAANSILMKAVMTALSARR